MPSSLVEIYVREGLKSPFAIPKKRNYELRNGTRGLNDVSIDYSPEALPEDVRKQLDRVKGLVDG